MKNTNKRAAGVFFVPVKQHKTLSRGCEAMDEGRKG